MTPEYKRLTVLLVVFCLGVVSQAQQFLKTYGNTDYYDRGNAICQISDGSFAIAGRTVNFGSGGGVNAFLMKTDKNGAELWHNSYGGKGSEEINSIDNCPDGGYILAGYTNSYGAGAADFYLLRTDSIGKEMWHKTFGGDGIERAYSVYTCRDGGFIVAGETYSFGEGWVNAYIIRTDAVGDTLWTKVIGGNGIEEAHSVWQCNDDGFVITGATNSFGAGDYDIYLIRLGKDGHLVWTKTFGGTGSEQGISVTQPDEKSFVIAGYTTSYGNGGTDMILIKTDDNGEQLWVKTFGGKVDDFARSVAMSKEGGFILGGYSNSGGNGMDVMLIKTDDNGELDWEKYYGSDSDEYGMQAIQCSDGGYAIAGSVIRQGGAISTEKIKDVLLIKTNYKGN